MENNNAPNTINKQHHNGCTKLARTKLALGARFQDCTHHSKTHSSIYKLLFCPRTTNLEVLLPVSFCQGGWPWELRSRTKHKFVKIPFRLCCQKDVRPKAFSADIELQMTSASISLNGNHLSAANCRTKEAGRNHIALGVLVVKFSVEILATRGICS